jgi:hypothetical protein
VQVEDRVEIVTVENLTKQKEALLAQVAEIDAKLEDINAVI